MKILFDLYGQQVQAQVSSGTRLTGLFDCLTDAGYEYDIATGALSASALSGYDVLVLTSRMDVPFAKDELSAITSFVKNGGGLWCMGNHSGFSLSNINNNHIHYTSSVCSTFWSAFEAAAYSSITSTTQVNLTGANVTTHPTIVGEKGWPIAGSSTSTLVGTIATRSFCAVYPNAFSNPIAELNNLSNVENTQNNAPVTAGVQWAIGLSDANSVGKGRVVICGDSGWIGNTTSTYPGPGEFQNEDNAQYALNTVSWLGQV